MSEETVSMAVENEEKKQNGSSFDLNDFTIIKEGDAEILMHAKNEVFYNNSQVFNNNKLFLCFKALYMLITFTYTIIYVRVNKRVT